MKLKYPGHHFINIITTISAGAVYAIALKYFVLPSKIILTGTEGIASSLYYYFENYALFIVLYLIFQAGLITFAFIRVGKAFAVRSLIVILSVAFFLIFLPELRFAQPEPQNERIILVLFGGLLAGVAKAIAFRNNGSTGDEDILGAYFAMKYLRPVGSIAILAAVGSTIFGLIMDYLKHGDIEVAINTLMYTCIYIFVSAETLNNLYRKFKITLVVIITKTYESVSNAISTTFNHRTYTVQKGIGGYSGESFWMVKTIIARDELGELVDAVELADPQCFYYHHEIEGVSNRYFITPIE